MLAFSSFFRPRALLGLLFIALMMGGMALGLFASSAQALPAAVQAFNHEDCRPDGMARTAGVDAPYCLAYDAEGRELMGGRTRRVIGYFTSWRNGSKGDPAYLVSDIPWERLTHINYAFAHIDDQGAISVGDVSDPNNPATGMEWPGVAGAEMDLTLPYKGHFNLLHQYKQQYPNVKVLISVGGWAETGGYFDAQGNRVNNGGFYTLTVNNDNTINTAAIDSFADSVVAFLRQYPFFDGVDIDYEYPTSMQDAGNPLDWGVANPRRAALMQGYVVLLKTLREKLDAAAAQDGKYYFLTIAAPSSGYLLRGMEAYQATQYLDYVNIMSYDLHGAWNKYVGPNAALYDQGNDSELASWNVYNTAAYGGIGYLNTDWAYHYFRGSMPAGRINIGVPFYTRGWKNVTGGTNGLWGEAPGSNCPTGLTSCGDGAVGIDNLWHDVDENGQEIGAGSNPMWHAKNLEAGILPDYLADYGLDPAADPADQLTGVYQRFYDAGLVAPWLWNDAKNVFLSIEDEESLAVKAQYVVDKGIGGIMFWELAGDYAWHPNRNNGQGEYFMGDTLVTLIANAFDNAPPYGNRKNPDPIPAQSLDVSIALENFPIGDNNYPINPEFVITNHSNITLPAGAEVQFDYPTSAPSNMKDWSGVGVQVIASDHTAANNIGGLQGDFHRAAFTLPQDIPPGGSYRFELVYYLPISGPSNFSIAFGGQTYALGADHYAAYVTGPTPTPTPLPTNTPTLAATSTPLPTATPTPTPAATNTPAPTATSTPAATATPTTPPTATPTPATGACTAPPWDANAVYVADDVVSHNGHEWRAKWWTQGEEPGTTGEWGVWEDLGPCSAASPTPTPTPAPTNTPAPTATSTPAATATPTTPPTATPTPATGACTAPPWDANAVYVADDVVSHNGHEWRAKWWTQGEEPGTTGEWGVWEDLGPCSAASPTPTPIPTNTPAATATPTPTPAATNTPAPTATPTPGPTPTPAPTPAHEIVAYFTQWGIYGRQYFVKDIVANGAADKLTVINYAFGHIKDGECVMVTQTGVMDAYADYQKSFTAAQSVDGVADQWNQPLRGNFNQLKKLKAMYPNLKVLISLGGWTWSEGFSDAALTPESRARAAATCIDIYLRGNLPLQDGAGGPAAAFGVFDGIDIDWEYPAMPANDGHVYRPEDTQNFTLLLEEFRRQLDALEQETGREYLLTIAAPAGVDKYEKIELDKIHPYLDWINLMTYDMHGGWESATNHQAPIYHNPNDPSAYPASEYNIDNAVQAYLNAGVPAGKLLVGVPFYGRGWKGVPNVNNGLFQSATGAAPGTWEAGIEDYKVLKTKGYPLFRDDVAKAAWLYNGDEFWSFDDPVVIADKMAYVKALGLRGAMAWSLDGDDGTLMTAIYNGLN